MTRVCKICGETKPISEFHSRIQRGHVSHRHECKTCLNKLSVVKVAQWRIDNPGKRDAADKRYRIAHSKDCKQRVLEWAKRFPDKVNLKAREWRIANPNKSRETQARFRASHKDKVLAWNNNRRARLLNAEGNIFPNEWELQIELYDHRCVYCGKQHERLSMDHVVPISRGGKHVIGNVVPACRSCNSKKGAYSLIVFLYRTNQNGRC